MDVEGGNGRRATAMDLVAAMTLEEVVSMLSGARDWETASVERLGVPAIRLSDGPSGVRGLDWLTSTSWNTPCGSSLGATWDAGLVERVGRLIGRDARDKGVAVHLAPNVNLQRSPVGGRNFECLSEDPTLAGGLALAYVAGVQSEGVSSCPKHFVGNDIETERFTVDVQVDERTLREVYLRPFEDVIERGGAGAVMAAYNSVNGRLMSENADLLTGVLRGDWGFTGPVISDWFCVRSTVDALMAGCDLEMPGPARQRGERLVEAIHAGEMDVAHARSAAERVAAFALDARERQAAQPHVAPPHDTAEERALLREAAAGGMVLLRNQHTPDGVPALPLDSQRLGSLAVIGPNARTGQMNGGGSAIVRPRHPTHLLAALRAHLPDDVEIRHAPGCSIERTTPLLDPALCGPLVLQLASDRATDWAHGGDRELVIDTTKLLWFSDPFDRPGSPRFAARLLTTFRPDRSGGWKFGIRSVGDAVVLVDGQIVADNADVPLPSIAAMGKAEQMWELDLVAGSEHDIEVRLVRHGDGDGLSAALLTAAPPALVDPIADAVATAAGADVAVVIVGTNADWESEGRDRTDIALPGEQDELVRRVAAAARSTIVVVNAGAPVAMPWLDDVDAVLMAWFPGEALGDALAEVLIGVREPSGRLPLTFPRSLADAPAGGATAVVEGVARYREGRLIGHRWYQARGIEPLFPFGHGLGYGSVRLDRAETTGPLQVRVVVENTGATATKACIQVYVGRTAGDAPADEPVQQLAGFARAAVEPGCVAEVDVELHPRSFEHWDVASRAWVPSPGPFELRIGTSCVDLPLTLVVGQPG